MLCPKLPQGILNSWRLLQHDFPWFSMRLVALEVVKLVWAIWAIFHRRFLSGRRMWIFAGLGGDGNHNNDDLPSLNDLWQGAIGRGATTWKLRGDEFNMDGVSS